MTYISQNDPHLWVAILEHLDAEYWLRPEQISEVARRGLANRKQNLSPEVPDSGRDREQWLGIVDLACHSLLRRNFAELGPGRAWRITPAGAEWLRRFGGVRRTPPTPSQARQRREQAPTGQPGGPTATSVPAPRRPVRIRRSSQATVAPAGMGAPVDAGTGPQPPSAALPSAPQAASSPPITDSAGSPRPTVHRAVAGGRVRQPRRLLGAMQRRHIARAAAQPGHSRIGVIDRYLLAVAAHELELYTEAMALIDTALIAGLDGEFANRAQQLRSVCAAKALG